MKYIFLLALVAMSNPYVLSAHDGSLHVEAAWYQDNVLLGTLVALIIACTLLVVGSYYLPRLRTIFAGVGIAGLVFSIAVLQANHVAPTTVSESVVATLTDVPVTVYRTEGCSCCNVYAEELDSTGAKVTVETITAIEMTQLKKRYNITREQESCHTSIINGYVVEGHVPFAAVAQLVTEQPDITGITLPGMPIGTPGMPGRQTEVYYVTSLDNELYWQSS